MTNTSGYYNPAEFIHSVYWGTTAPTVQNFHVVGAEYYVTDTGDQNGKILEHYIFTSDGNWVNITPTTGGGLPTPKVRLNNNGGPVQLNWYKYAGNTSGGTYSIYRYPEVVTMDLTQEQIDKGVYIEMVSYHRGKKQFDKNNDSAYKIPASWEGGVNTLQAIAGGPISTRGGDHSIHINMGGGILQVDRLNHFKVSNINEVLPVWKYLQNRMSIIDVAYRDTTGTDSTTPCLCPSQGMRRFANLPGSKFGYASRYTPFYFRFRYIMKDEKGYGWISGPLSPVIKMTQDEHPFEFDAVASTTNGAVCLNLNPLANPEVARCMFETKLP